MNYSILMADIIQSRVANSKQLMSDFKSLVEFINKKWKKSIHSPLTITMGDEFQGVVGSKESAIRIIIDIEEEIIRRKCKFKLRYVFNFGQIDTPINNSRAYEMLGMGLTQAREKLEILKKANHRFLFLKNGMEERYSTENDLFRIFEYFVDEWKSKDFPFLLAFLDGKSYQEVALALDVNVSSAWRRKNSLNLEEYFILKKLLLKPNY
jgi:hypothetical protein